MKTLITVFCLLPLLAFFGNNSTKDHSSQNYNISEKTILNCPEPPSFYEYIDQGKSKSVSQDEIDQDWYSRTLGKIEKEEYNITFNEKLGAYQSPNRANNIRFTYHNDGFTAITRDDADDWSIRFGITNYELRIKNGDFRVDGNKACIGNEKIRIDYANTKEGMRQDFIIKEKPEGNGKLRLNMSVDTKLKMIVGSDALMFKSNDGNEKMKYSQLKCWDAEGKELRAYFEKNSTSPNSTFNSGFSIVVNDDNTTYPITIDPLSTSPDWTAESNQYYALLGCVASAGDVNGDGYGDVIIGMERFDNDLFDEGRAYVYHGSPAGLSTSANWFAEGNQEGAFFGARISTAGDVNGDGYSDIIVGAPIFDNGESNEGRAFVYHGSSTGLSAIANWTAECNQADAYLGYPVSTAGDVNGDGYSDVIVTAEQYDNDLQNEGRIYVYHGSSSGLSVNANWVVEGDQSEAQFGSSVSSAGDVNGDGYSDIIIGAPTFDNGETDEGKLFFHYGSASGLSLTPDWTFECNNSPAHLGYRVSTAGDVNGDGYSDIIAGAGHYSGNGRVYVFHGSSVGFSSTPDWIVDSEQMTSVFGGAVSTAGDVNGDGYSDVIVGASLYDSPEYNEGKTFVYHGSASGLSTSPAWTYESNQPGAEFGHWVSTAGDVNGDGYSEVIVASFYYESGEYREGKAFLFHGSAAGLSVPVSWTAESDQANAQFGYSVSTAGDVNGDGYSDVIVGAHLYDNGQTDEGRVFVYHGSATGLSATASWTAESDQENAHFGGIVSTAGDVNGDGYSDVIVGANEYQNGQFWEGRVFVYHGSASGLSATANWTAESDQAYALFGQFASTAGDVNGDGYSDVIVGAYRFDNGQFDEGRAYVYHGSASGLSATANWTAESDQDEAGFGYSVSSAGDVNGDGYSDVIVGAHYYDNGQSDEGMVFVYHGSASGLSATANWTAEGNQADAYFAWCVSTAGDVNGDGYSDVIVGAHLYDNGLTDEGTAFVYHGSQSGLSATASWTAEINQGFAWFGYSVSTAGDVNGDGYSDAIVGSHYYDNGQTNEGRTYVFHGSSTGLSATASWTAESDQDEAVFGQSVSTAGDVNGDGYCDVIVGANQYDNGQTDEGRAFVYYGNGGTGLRSTVQQYRPGTSTVVSSGGLTGTEGQVRLNIFGRSPFGRADGRMVYEYKDNGVKFSGAIITNSTSSSGSGINTDLGTSITGVQLNSDISGLLTDKEYKWRARVQYSPVNNPYQKFGPWKYYNNYTPIPLGNFRASGRTMLLNLTVFMQGFYFAGGNLMVADTVTVYLRNNFSPYSVSDSAKALVNSSGLGTYTFSNAVNGIGYYIHLKHRNSIETWSKIPQTFVGNSLTYNFSTASTQAFGNNMKLVDVTPVRFAIYGGDVNQDGTVDATDVSMIDNGAANFVTGYVLTDLTGDNFVDATDFAIADNNAANFISVIGPKIFPAESPEKRPETLLRK